MEIVREEPDFVFVDELEENGDQSNVVTERVLIDRENQTAAHQGAPLWLEWVRRNVELGIAITLAEAMRSRGFRLDLISAAHLVPTTTNIHAPQGADFDPEQARIHGHYEPAVYRATFEPRDPADV